MSVSFTRQAENDLNDIWDYTHYRWGIEQAEIYVRDIRKAVENITGLSPAVRRPFEQFGDVESIRVNHHYVFMRRDGADVSVIALLHERMDLVSRVTNRLG